MHLLEFLQDLLRNRTAYSAIFALEGFNMGKASYSAIFAPQEKDGDMAAGTIWYHYATSR